MEHFIGEIVAGLGTAVSSAILWGLWLLRKVVQEKTKSSVLKRAAAGFERVISSVVIEQNQTLADGLRAAKDPSSPGGTKLTPEEVQRLFRNARNKVWELFSMEGLSLVFEAFTGSSPDSVAQVDQFISTKIEEAVAVTKATRKAVEAGRVPPLAEAPLMLEGRSIDPAAVAATLKTSRPRAT